MSFIKKMKNMLPASKHQVKHLEEKLIQIEKKIDKLDSISQKQEKDNKKYLENKFKFTDSQIEHKFQDTNNRIIDLRNRFLQAELREVLERQNALLKKYNTSLEQANHQIQVLQHELVTFKCKSIRDSEETLGYARENNWGLVFNNTITGCEWLTDHAFSLGRWAIGYQSAYVLFRVLNEVKPNNMLELGLGQSTKILGQYAGYHKNVRHTVVESDLSWIDFFRNNYELSSNTNILHCDCGFCDYMDAKDVRVFDDFGEKIAGNKFDLIVIDAPIGGDMTDYSRIDVLQNLPECLADTFVIVIDDAERPGEQNTWKAMKQKLEEAEIPCASGLYRGKKFAGLIVSENLKFLLTM